MRLTLFDHIPLLLFVPAALMGFMIRYWLGKELSIDGFDFMFFVLFGPQIFRHIQYSYEAWGMSLTKLDSNHFKLFSGAEEILLNDETIEGILIKTSPGNTLGHEHYLETIFTMKEGGKVVINSLVVDPDYFLDKFTTMDKISETKSLIKKRHTTPAIK